MKDYVQYTGSARPARPSTSKLLAVLCAALLLLAGTPVQAQEALASKDQVVGINSPQLQLMEMNLGKLNRVIDLRLDDASLREAVRTIAAEGDLDLVYREPVMEAGETITVDMPQTTVLEALHEVLRRTELRLHLTTSGHLILTEKPEADARELAPPVQTAVIAGRVVDAETGDVLPGVNVAIVGTTHGASTDVDGRYQITGLDAGTYAVQASFIGYQTSIVEGVVAVENETTELDFRLAPAAVGLDEVVVVGYGEQRRRDLTGSVSSVTPERMTQVSMTSLDQGLRGVAAGVNVTQMSGQPGAGTTMRIRGGTSIAAGNEPLYVIDGVPVVNSSGSVSAGSVQGPDINPLASINPADIESVQILKDASATSIYGSRGANGVILITTRSGKSGEANVDFSASYESQQPRRLIPMLDATQFARLVNEAALNDGLAPVYTEAEISSFGEGTNWQEEIFRTAPAQNYQLSFTGGDQNVRYAISGNYFDQEGIILNSDFRRLSLRANLSSTISEKFRVGNTLTVSRTNANQVRTDTDGGAGTSVVLGALMMNPILPVYQEDGTFVMENDRGIPLGNPVAQALELTNETELTRILGNVYGEYDLADGLTARVSLGADVLGNKENYYAPSYNHRGLPLNGTGSVGTVSSTTWLNENTLTYDRQIGDRHSLNVLGGVTFQASRRELLRASADNFATDKLTYHNLGAGAVAGFPQTGTNEWGLVSYLGRVNYSFADKYLVTATTRVDGSSKFGAGNKYGFFPSGALAWRLSSEPFVQRLGLFDDLKLRTSYGLTGNQEIGIYQSLALMNDVNYVFGGNQVNTGFAATRIANPDLKWETTAQFNVGVDAEFWQNRLSLTADYYSKKTTNLLLQVPLSWASGYGTSLQNVGSIKNSGVELALGMRESIGALVYNLNFNIAANESEVLDLAGAGTFFSGGNSGHLKVGDNVIVTEGEEIGTFYGLVYDGIFRDETEVAASAQPNALPGQVRYKDLSGDGKINDDDRTVLGYAQPELIGGFGGNVYYRNFDLAVNASFVYGNEIFNFNKIELELPTGQQNNSTAALDRWTPDNPDATIPRATLARQIDFSDRYLEDGSYLRLQNVTLGYSLPAAMTTRLNLRRLRIYAAAQNLITLTEYSGFDPEVSRFGQDNLSQGYDYGGYPTARAYRMGIDVGF